MLNFHKMNSLGGEHMDEIDICATVKSRML
jgi:hypothetical protein